MSEDRRQFIYAYIKIFTLFYLTLTFDSASDVFFDLLKMYLILQLRKWFLRNVKF